MSVYTGWFVVPQGGQITSLVRVARENRNGIGPVCMVSAGDSEHIDCGDGFVSDDALLVSLCELKDYV